MAQFDQSVESDVAGRATKQVVVYRVDTGGKVFVLDDTAYREVKALAPARDGSLYVAAIDGKEKESASPSLAPIALPTVEVTVSETVTAVAPVSAPPAPSPPPAVFEGLRAASSRGGLLKIAASGEVDLLWSSNEDAPHSMLLEADGVPVVYARSMMPRRNLRGPWTRFTGLGNRPLGAALFADPRIVRQPLHVARLDGRDRRYHLATAVVPEAGRALWARRSVFLLAGRPLLVCEVFLPGIGELPP